MLKVLLAAAEAVPFAKTGGLADVIGSLPLELRRLGIDARVVMPKYGDIPGQYKEQFEQVAELTVPVGWRNQYCGVEVYDCGGVPFYFIDNEYYFRRAGLYGYYDDGERFAFFSRAIPAILPHIGFQPDVLHCHDWHAAMAIVLLGAHYRQEPFYANIRTLFTIHNLKYQGVFAPEVLGELLSLGPEYFTPETLEFHGAVNYMKGGLLFADAVTTVSPSYAGEIQEPWFGEQLDGILRKRQGQLHGILNGIDCESYNPATDPALFVNYSWRSIGRKRQNKLKLQELLGLPQSEDTPLLAIVSRLVEPKGLDLVTGVFEQILDLNVQLVVLGSGDEKYESMFRIAAHQRPQQVSANIFFDETLARRIYAASDLFVMPSQFEPCGIGQLIAMRYGSLPVVRETGGLRDTVTPYDPVSAAGSGFCFPNYNAHELLSALQSAVALYEQRPAWTKLAQQAMRQDFSWRRSAALYRDLYQQL
ncbi:MAG: glycogen synthase GlgA [Sporomusaceae bacterium]|nr:glycogen synthase GlgA [Sporomusaceae bacterium]